MTTNALSAWSNIGQGKLMNTLASIDSVSGDIATVGAVSASGTKLTAGTNGAQTLTIQGNMAQASALTITMPATTGTDGQVLATDGNGVLSFTPNGIQSVASGSATALAVTGTNNLTVTLNAELTALAALSTTGLVSRTASGAYADRTLTAGNTGNIAITNGDGVSGNPTVELSANIAVTNLGATNIGTTRLGFAFMTSADRDAIATPVIGSMVFVSDDAGTTGALNVFTGAAWQVLTVV